MIDALVTGAGGFIGRALVQRLQSESRQIATLTRADGDVIDTTTWDNLPPARTLYHLAGRTFVPDSWQDPTAFLSANVIGTERAVEYCLRHGASLVMAGAYVYSRSASLPTAEHAPVCPSNPYALSKVLAEQVCEFAAHAHTISTTVLRLFNVYGPGQGNAFLLPHIIEQVRCGLPIKVQNLAPKRDYVFLDDVIDALVKAGALSTPEFRRFNIGSGTSLSVAQVIDTIQRLAGTQLPVLSENLERPGEISETRADISQALSQLGWRPHWSFADGIRAILNRSPA